MVLSASNWHLEVVKWLHANRPEFYEEVAKRCDQINFPIYAMDAVAGEGHLHVIRWLRVNGKEASTSAAMDQAAAHGHLHIVR